MDSGESQEKHEMHENGSATIYIHPMQARAIDSSGRIHGASKVSGNHDIILFVLTLDIMDFLEDT